MSIKVKDVVRALHDDDARQMNDLLKAYGREVNKVVKLVHDIYKEFKRTWGNCPFCHADEMHGVTAGASTRSARPHGHPTNCLWHRIEEVALRWKPPRRRKSTKR